MFPRNSPGGLPNLWIPGADSFIKIDALPLLGSGKLDLGAVKKIALMKIREGERREY